MVARSGEYYFATVANLREEYYTGSGESPGFWLGGYSRRLGLEGGVNPDGLRQVLAGVHPVARPIGPSALNDLWGNENQGVLRARPRKNGLKIHRYGHEL
jgi:hypothetical protein